MWSRGRVALGLRVIASTCKLRGMSWNLYFFFQAEDGIRDVAVTGVQTCALPISFFIISSMVCADGELHGKKHKKVASKSLIFIPSPSGFCLAAGNYALFMLKGRRASGQIYSGSPGRRRRVYASETIFP